LARLVWGMAAAAASRMSANRRDMATFLLFILF